MILSITFSVFFILSWILRNSSSIFICTGWWEFRRMYMSWVEIEDNKDLVSSWKIKSAFSSKVYTSLFQTWHTLSDFVMFLMCFPNLPKFFFIFIETSLSACKASSEWVNFSFAFKMLTKDGFLESCITLETTIKSILYDNTFRM